MHFHAKTLSCFYPPKPVSATLTTATLTDSVSSHVWSLRFSSSGAAGAGTIGFSLPIFSTDQSIYRQQSTYPRTLDLWYRVGDDAATGTIAAALYDLTLTASGTKPAATSLASADLTNTAGYYKATLTPSAPFWVNHWKGLFLTLSITGTVGYNIYFYGCRLNFEFRR